MGQASSGLAPGVFSAVSWHTACTRRSATHQQSCGRRGADGTHLPGGRTRSHALTRLPGCRQFTAKHRDGKAEGDLPSVLPGAVCPSTPLPLASFLTFRIRGKKNPPADFAGLYRVILPVIYNEMLF